VPIVSVLRDRSDELAPHVTSMELFFDLVYVFAVTQLSHTLLEHLSWGGALRTTVLLLAVWWAWNYTAWATNWIDPDRAPVRILMLVLMLLSLVMSAAIPAAFAGKGLTFAVAYVTLQLLRSGFMVVVLQGKTMGRNYAQLLAWSALAGVFWVAGGFAHGDTRLALWIAALVIDYAAPLVGFWLPRAGITPLIDWTLRGGHLAERCQLVIIIALGESILIAGQTYSGLPRSAAVVAAFVTGFACSAALWWIYFVRHADEAADAISHSENPTRMGRAGFAYAHVVMVAGIIVTAVGIDLAVTHPRGDTGAATALVILGGPALYLVGNAIFHFTVTRRRPTLRLAAVVVLAALAPLALVASPLALSVAATAVLLALAVATSSPARALV
jgi:low temperature requirement protein LtrA